MAKNKDMEFYEERERMRQLLQMTGKITKNNPNNFTSITTSKSGPAGMSGMSGTSGPSGNGLSGSSGYDRNTTFLGTTQNTKEVVVPENKGEKVKFNITPIESEREKMKTSWKFWKK